MPIFNNREPQYAEHVEGGVGRMQRDRLLEGDQLGGVCSYVAQISLEPGCSIGIHQHVGDSEMYFLTAGDATYTATWKVLEPAVPSGSNSSKEIKTMMPATAAKRTPNTASLISGRSKR